MASFSVRTELAMKSLFFGNRVGVPMISFLDKIRTAVGETLGGAGTTGVPGIGREPRPFFENP